MTSHRANRDDTAPTISAKFREHFKTSKAEDFLQRNRNTIMNFFVRNPNSHNNRNPSTSSPRWAIDEFNKSYTVKEMMGEGSFGTVHKVRSRIRSRVNGLLHNKQTDFTFACKTIPKSKVEDIRILKAECSNLEDVRGHPHLLEYKRTFEDDDEVHIITELLEGGELYETILEFHKKRASFAEDDSAWMVRNILDGLSYCHDVMGIVHRDLKASNFMFKRKIDITDRDKRNRADSRARMSQNLRDIKIIDFGLSTKIDPDTGKVQGCMGTPYYVAPEVLTEVFYDTKCDVWSAGVIAYLILSKQLPFQGKDEVETIDILKNVEHHQPKYDSARWMTLDPLAVHFCKTLLQTDPSKRPTAREAMSHPWIVKHCGKPPAQRPRINPEHTIAAEPTEEEDEELKPPSPLDSPTLKLDETFDSERSNCTRDTARSMSPSNIQRCVGMDPIPERHNRSSKKLFKKNSMKRWFSGKSQRAESETVHFIDNIQYDK